MLAGAHSSTDRVPVFGTGDEGSNPPGRTLKAMERKSNEPKTPFSDEEVVIFDNGTVIDTVKEKISRNAVTGEIIITFISKQTDLHESGSISFSSN